MRRRGRARGGTYLARAQGRCALRTRGARASAARGQLRNAGGRTRGVHASRAAGTGKLHTTARDGLG
eukprot:1237746-Pleurochrysis_carterae.AAC.1